MWKSEDNTGNAEAVEKASVTNNMLITGIEYGVYMFIALMFAGRFGTLRELGLYIPPLLWLVRSAVMKQSGLKWTEPLFLALALLSLFALFSSLLSAPPFIALHLFKQEYLKLLLLYFVISTTFASLEKLRRLAGLTALCGVAYIIYGIFLMSDYLLSEGSIDYGEMRNYATIFLFFLPFIILQFLKSGGWKRLLWMISLLSSISGILLTGVRGSWLGLTAVFAIWSVVLLKFRSRHVAFLLKLGIPVIATLLAAVFLLFPAQFDLLKQRIGVRSPISDRLEAWQHYLAISGETPLFGHGLDDDAMTEHYRESYKDATGAYPSAGKPLTPHNQFVKILYQQGIAGLTLYILLLGTLLYRTGTVALSSAPVDFSLIGVAVVSAVAGEYIVRCLTEVRSLVPLGVLIGMAGAFVNIRTERINR